MKSNLSPKIFEGYKNFRSLYGQGKQSLMNNLALNGQNPEIMIVACSDSRVDPAILFQCDPGDIFSVRNVANIIPPYENDSHYHGTSAALEFGVCYLKVKHIIILGHSSCGGVEARVKNSVQQTDFINHWVEQIDICSSIPNTDVNAHAKKSIITSYNNCMTFPWINEKVKTGELRLHPLYLEIADAEIYEYDKETDNFEKIDV